MGLLPMSSSTLLNGTVNRWRSALKNRRLPPGVCQIVSLNKTRDGVLILFIDQRERHRIEYNPLSDDAIQTIKTIRNPRIRSPPAESRSMVTRISLTSLSRSFSYFYLALRRTSS